MSSSRGNLLLDALGAAARVRMLGRARRVQTHEVLSDSSGWNLDLYFPHAGAAISLVRSTDEGPELEIAMIGSEGFATVDALLARGGAGDVVAVVRAAGELTCINAQRLRLEFATDARARAILSDYAAVFLDQVSQSALCNGVHSVVQRLSKWLLALRDRTGSADLAISHESLSRIFGTHRPAVTLAIGTLANAGVIAHSRKSIRIRDVHGLKEHACGCLESTLASLSRFRTHLETHTE